MPKSSHIHKSMLLRGVRFPEAALNQADIEATKGRAARSGRAHGGVPLKEDGRGRNSFNYASSNQYPQSQNHQQSYGSQNGYNGYNNNYPVPPPSWQPPPPGTSGFARGPPPPLPTSYGSYGRGQAQAPSGYSQPPAYYGSQSGYGPPPGGYDRRRDGDSYRGGDSNRGRYGGQR
jgi:5'-3' exoribonuclease 2